MKLRPHEPETFWLPTKTDPHGFKMIPLFYITYYYVAFVSYMKKNCLRDSSKRGYFRELEKVTIRILTCGDFDEKRKIVTIVQINASS